MALAALAGTLLQMRESVTQLRSSPEAETFRTIDSWRGEVPLHRPLKRRRHLRGLREIRHDQPDDWRAYRRLWLVLLSWTLLTFAAAGATLDAIL
ncbi:MAG: hypothetical protein JWL79_3087 [Frankiales bacterium]|nr:hypothetical protein [Frankiales bacterium]